jgi:nicotinamide-nucleotide amidase
MSQQHSSAGRLALALSKGEGASQHLMGGVVAYTKEMKIRALGVPAELIQKGTAVCADVAEAMARGARRLSGATLAISITGVAGPEPDEDGNPVGLIYCDVTCIETSKVIELRYEAKQPDAIIDDACVEALKLSPLLSYLTFRLRLVVGVRPPRPTSSFTTS